MQNVAIQKLTTEFHQLYSACIDASLSHISGEPCLSSFNELPPLYKQKMINNLDRSLSTFDKEQSVEAARLAVDIIYKDQLKQTYFEYLVDDFVDVYTFRVKERIKLYKQSINDVTLITYCSIMSKNKSFLENLITCYDHKTQKFKNSVVVLVSSPYSEPMNYLLNIIWGHININLEHLKLLTEILKLSMIIGCASNFLIYIAMSEKLRDAMKRMFKCREHQETNVDTIESK
ncbi:unnamed protein product [Mytilus edulis]|uniref:Uncharacterized protein n=1 Tax=Mytilus edulis TaxID=6550 RepID=A0A8S3SD83_MYTED|nr:unnamed protein product [Mytilus edulis]